MVTKKAKKPKARVEKTTQREKSPHIQSAPDLEARRKDFQAHAAGKKAPIASPAGTDKKSQDIPRIRVIGVMMILLLLFVPLIAFAAYYSYHRSADRIVTDALFHTLTASEMTYDATVETPKRPIATFHGTVSEGKSAVDAHIRTTLPGDLNTAHVSVVGTESNLYLNIAHASRLFAETAPQTQKKAANELMPIVKNEVDGKWVRLQSNDMSYLQSMTRLSPCMVNALRSMATSSAARTALANAYAQHAFLEPKRIRGDGNIGTYQITINQPRLNAFLDATTSKGDTVLSKCTDDIIALKKSNAHEAVIEVGIDESKRVITKVVLSTSGNNPVTATIMPQLGTSAAIDVPVDATAFDDIKQKIMAKLLLMQNTSPQ